MLRYLVLFLSLFVISCATAPAPQPGGAYYGHLPCADCSGISYQLTLHQNSTYEARYRYDNQADIIINRGTYSVADDDHILLIGKTGPINNRIAIASDTLWLLNNDDERINGELKNKYALSRVRPQSYSLNKKAAKPSSAFEAHGNEPSWLLRSDLTKSLTFKTLDQYSLDLSIPLSQPENRPETNLTTYAATADTITIMAHVASKPCFDDMSGREFTHQVEVELLLKDKKLKTYSGCGSYAGNYRINDIWLLTHLNGKPINNTREDEDSPYIEFNIKSRRLMGFAGCNRFGGNFEFGKNTIRVSELFATEMACANPGPEELFLQLLNQQVLKYDIADLQLKLVGNSLSATFIKVD